MLKKKDKAEKEDKKFSKATVAVVLGGQRGASGAGEALSLSRQTGESELAAILGSWHVWQERGLMVLPPAIAARRSQLLCHSCLQRCCGLHWEM